MAKVKQSQNVEKGAKIFTMQIIGECGVCNTQIPTNLTYVNILSTHPIYVVHSVLRACGILIIVPFYNVIRA